MSFPFILQCPSLLTAPFKYELEETAVWLVDLAVDDTMLDVPSLAHWLPDLTHVSPLTLHCIANAVSKIDMKLLLLFMTSPPPVPEDDDGEAEIDDGNRRDEDTTPKKGSLEGWIVIEPGVSTRFLQSY